MSMAPLTTKEWAVLHGVCVDEDVPTIERCDELSQRSAQDVASRAIVLHCVAAVGYGVDPRPIMTWLEDQSLWQTISPHERGFLCSENPSDAERSDARWRQEALWALLWSINKIESLGLPTSTCDTGRLVDDIMPALGESVDSFITSAALRPSSQLLGEDDRIYNLHCYVRQAFRVDAVPEDLIYGVLFQRHYAFEWLGGDVDWDNVSTDT